MTKRLTKEVPIKFINVGRVHEEYYPIPAKHAIPDWYKETESNIKSVDPTGKGKYMDEFGTSSSTIKRCMPVFDAISAGYILVTHEDLYVDGDIGAAPFFYWTDSQDPSIKFHSPEQAEKHPNTIPDQGIPKWANNWAIITELGYSCMFLRPMHRDTPIMIFEGIVDTDTYHSRVQLPFVLKDSSFRGLIPAGTPIAQVIPFKRESYRYEVSETQEDLIEVQKSRKRLKSVFINSYKKKFWFRKEYN